MLAAPLTKQTSLKMIAIAPTSRHAKIAMLALLMIALHLVLKYGFASFEEPSARWSWNELPLLATLIVGGTPLLRELLGKLRQREFGADLLAGISIVTSVLLHEYLAGSIVVLMLSGGEALEAFAVRGASSVLEALAKRMPARTHRKVQEIIADIPLANALRTALPPRSLSDY